MDRAHILAEIRRTAVENGGVPLGRERFSAATGIRAYDWTKYWARWGDALREAGFQPNRFNPAIPEEELLERLAELVRELGRFPVFRELKIKAYRDPDFPSHQTFLRFGGMRALAARLQQFSQERAYDDVAALCAPAAKQHEESKTGPTSSNVELGFVYLIKSGRFYKIGRSNAVGRRERELAIQLPEEVRVVHSIKTDDPAGIEAYWHTRFAPKRRHGEWFELDAADVSAFRRRKFM